MYQTGLIERMGTGLEDLFKACKKAGLTRPKVEVSGFEFHITIYRRKDQVVPDKVPNKVPDKVPKKVPDKVPGKFTTALRLCRNFPYASEAELAKRMKITERAVRKQIKYLREQGCLVRIGAKRGGHWEVQT